MKGIPGNRATRTRGVKGKKGVKGYKGHPGQVTIRSVPYRGHEKGLIGAAGQVQGTGKDLTLKGAVGDAGLISVNLATGAIEVPVPSAPVGQVVPPPSDVVPAAVAASFAWSILYSIAQGLCMQQLERLSPAPQPLPGNAAGSSCGYLESRLALGGAGVMLLAAGVPLAYHVDATRTRETIMTSTNAAGCGGCGGCGGTGTGCGGA